MNLHTNLDLTEKTRQKVAETAENPKTAPSIQPKNPEKSPKK